MLNNKVLRDAEEKMVKVLSGKKWNWRGMGWGGCEGVGVGKREGGKVMLVPGSLWPPGGVAGCRTESAATSVRRFSSVSCVRSSSVGCRPQHLSPGVCAGYSDCYLILCLRASTSSLHTELPAQTLLWLQQCTAHLWPVHILGHPCFRLAVAVTY